MSERLRCFWCEQPFLPRSSGGKPQRFCRPEHRRFFHAAARLWAESAVTAGLLSLAELRRRSDIANGNVYVAPMRSVGCAATPLAPETFASVAPSNRTLRCYAMEWQNGCLADD